MRFARPASRGAIAGVSSVGAVAVAAAIVVVVTHNGSPSEQNVSAGAAHVPRAHLRVAHLRHHRVPYAKPLHVTIRNGALTAVKVQDANGVAVPGLLNPTRTSWRSQQSLVPLTRLTAAVSYVDLAHHTTTTTMTLRATDAKQHLSAVLSPGGGDTVGVGSPVIVSFNRAIPHSQRAAVQRRLSVTTSPSVVGAWHWMSDTEVHWRPPMYWKPGTKVTIGSDLAGLELSKGVWGAAGRHSTSFTIGPSHISEADVASHEMKVYDNGRLIRTLPMSAGRTEYPTKSGVHITFEKSQSIIMDSSTVGIPQGTPGAYRETVYWDVRISYGGAFVHAAPWSVADQGHSNVSHGCINLSTANATWFYNWARRGDIVDVFNSSAPVDTSDPGMADWNMSWKQWIAGDAAPTHAAKRLHPLLPRQGEPGFAPVKHHSHHHKHGSGQHH